MLLYLLFFAFHQDEVAGMPGLRIRDRYLQAAELMHNQVAPLLRPHLPLLSHAAPSAPNPIC